jgi:hypothetical protein
MGGTKGAEGRASLPVLIVTIRCIRDYNKLYIFAPVMTVPERTPFSHPFGPAITTSSPELSTSACLPPGPFPFERLHSFSRSCHDSERQFAKFQNRDVGTACRGAECFGSARLQKTKVLGTYSSPLGCTATGRRRPASTTHCAFFFSSTCFPSRIHRGVFIRCGLRNVVQI